MTSIILGRKLVSVKTSKNEFDKIKRLRTDTLEKKYNSISSLKNIIEQQAIHKTCRLCLKPGNRRLFDEDRQFDYVNCINNILNIQVAEDDGKPQHLCETCETTLKHVELLKQTAEVNQWRLQQELDMLADETDDDGKVDNSYHGGYFVKKTSKLTREWACRKCRRTFETQVEFSEHEGSPTCRVKNKCYMCEICGLELKTMTRLKNHRLIHSSVLAHACRQCAYRGRDKYALAAHQRVHGGAARSFACPHCPATFYNSSNLASHRRGHLPPMYHCQMCEKSFKFKQALENHMATQHSTAKPHICNLCGKAFSTRKIMCRHERTVHNRPKMRLGALPTYLRLQQGLDT